MRNYLYPIGVLLVLLFLTSCSPLSLTGSALQGRILVWHDWRGAEAEVLDELFEKFNDVYPDVRIIRAAIPLDEQNLQEEFVTHTQTGLGPDLLIFRASSIPAFAELGLIQPLPQDESFEVEGLSYQGEVYGLPFSLSTDVLYYNRTMVRQVPETLTDLLNQAYAGRQLALNRRFDGAFWGLQASASQVFDEEGRVLLNQGGFNNWLGWLKNTQSVPNMILSPDKETLIDLFTSGKVAYYVGNSRELPTLQAKLGTQAVRVAPLPAGPIAEAGPLLQTDTLMFSRASDREETELALRLAEFLTNVEQQTILAMKEVGRLPTNSRVTLDERVSPIAVAFAKQSDTAVRLPLANTSRMEWLKSRGDEVYAQVLAGVKERNDAIDELLAEMNAISPVTTLKSESQENCIAGRIRVVHGWQLEEAQVLEQIRRNFMQGCPKSIVDLVASDLNPTLRYLEYRDAVLEGKGPDLLIDSTDLDLFPLMISNDLLLDISQRVTPNQLQSFVPRAQEAMRSDGKLYGLPLSMDVMALYYNKEMVRELPATVDDLLAQAAPKQLVAIPLGFQASYWGVPAFGGKLVDDKNQVILNEGGFVEWLEWLREAQNESGIVMSSDPYELLDLFVQEEAAYLIADNQFLTLLQQELGEERVGVTPLPAGPRGAAGPLLRVEGFMINPASSEIDLALEFATFATSIESQQLLLEQNKRVPANVNVHIREADPAIAQFAEQAKTATVPPNTRELSQVWQQELLFDYEEQLNSDNELQEMVNDFTTSINDYNRFILKAKKPVLACEGEGELLLWHSWQVDSLKYEALEALIEDFMDSCPRIDIKSLFVSTEEVIPQLTSAEIQPPDFFLLPHDLISSLKAENSIKRLLPISGQDRVKLGTLHSWATDAFEQDAVPYGLPLTGDLLALYYYPERVGNLVENVDQLMSHASSVGMALDSSFYGGFWGLSAFGGQVVDEEGKLVIQSDGFVEWLRWLKTMQNKPYVRLSEDQEILQARFASGEVAYLVAGVDALASLSFAVAPFRITSLPAGPGGQGKPFLRVEGFLFSAQSSDEQTNLAYQFAEFATSVYSQKQLVEQATLLPANLDVQIELNSPMAYFAEHAGESILLPPRADASRIFEAGDEAYRNVLENDQSPNQAVSTFEKEIGE